MKKFVFVWALLFFPFLLMSAESETTYHFELPVNWTSSPKYNLEVTIPKGFTSLQPLEKWSDKETTMIEFVPDGENGENWQEIITLHKFLGKKVDADALVVALKKRMLESVENGRILEQKTEQKNDYTRSEFTLSYDLKGKHEVLGVRYYSGPYDLVGAQYTLRPQKEMTDEEALSKIQNFFESSTKISNYSREPGST